MTKVILFCFKLFLLQATWPNMKSFRSFGNSRCVSYADVCNTPPAINQRLVIIAEKHTLIAYNGAPTGCKCLFSPSIYAGAHTDIKSGMEGWSAQ